MGQSATSTANAVEAFTHPALFYQGPWEYLAGTVPFLTPRNYLYAFFENVHVFRDNAGTPMANVSVYLDNDRFHSPDSNVRAEDRRVNINLARGNTFTIGELTVFQSSS